MTLRVPSSRDLRGDLEGEGTEEAPRGRVRCRPGAPKSAPLKKASIPSTAVLSPPASWPEERDDPTRDDEEGENDEDEDEDEAPLSLPLPRTFESRSGSRDEASSPERCDRWAAPSRCLPRLLPAPPGLGPWEGGCLLPEAHTSDAAPFRFNVP